MCLCAGPTPWPLRGPLTSSTALDNLGAKAIDTASAAPKPTLAARVVNLGCRLNAYEGDVVTNLISRQNCERVVINTCAVTAAAERQNRQAIRRAARDYPEAEIVVTGCAAQINPAAYAGMTEVTRVVGNEEKLYPQTWNPAIDHPKVSVGDIFAVHEMAPHLLGSYGHRTRAFVQVQQGCDHRCTFCVIPYGRGKARSVPLGDVVRQVRALVAEGTLEVVLTGVDLTSYGPDLPGSPCLGQMVRRLLAQVPELLRLRLSSIDCIEIDADLTRLIAEEPRLMPHLHLSLQAGHDLTLKRMKRRHSRAQAVNLCRTLRALRPDLALGADLIAGFPTETDDMFQGSLDLIDDCGLSYVHVFPFSPRQGTPAARMPQVAPAVRKHRAARLRQAAVRAHQAFLSQHVGKSARVLMEAGGLGRAENFAPYRVDAPQGQLLNVRAQGIEDHKLIAEEV